VDVTASPPGNCTSNNTRLVTFQATVTGVTPQNYEWSFPGGTSPQPANGLGSPPPITVEYPAATASTPTASCTVRIFNGLCSYMGSAMVAIGKCGDGPPPPPPPDGGGLCAGLLISAITLLVLGAASIIIGVCFNVPPLIIVGAIAAGLGLLLFILWVVLCSRFTPCSVMQTMHCILFFLIAVVAPIIFVLAIVFGGLACAIAVASAWGGWGTIYAWLGVVMGQVNCPKIC
jgi:MFS family permease